MMTITLWVKSSDVNEHNAENNNNVDDNANDDDYNDAGSGSDVISTRTMHYGPK